MKLIFSLILLTLSTQLLAGDMYLNCYDQTTEDHEVIASGLVIFDGDIKHGEAAVSFTAPGQENDLYPDSYTITVSITPEGNLYEIIKVYGWSNGGFDKRTLTTKRLGENFQLTKTVYCNMWD